MNTSTPQIESGTNDDSADGYEARSLSLTWGRQLPIIRQAESGECGLACLAMIAHYYGNAVGLSRLRQRLSPPTNGTSVFTLVEWAQLLGMTARPLTLSLEEIRELRTPCILHWSLDHFVVLKKVKGAFIDIHDPALGRRRVKLSEVEREFTGVAIELLPGRGFQRAQAPPPVPLKTLAGPIQGINRALIHIFALALSLEALTLLTPQFTQIIVDQVLGGSDSDLLTIVGICFALLLLIQVILSAFRSWSIAWLGSQFSLGWTANAFQHLLRLPQQYFLSRSLGDIVSRFSSITVIQQTLTTQFVGALLDGIMALVTLSMLFLYSPRLASLVAATVVLYLGVRLLYFRSFREANIDLIAVNARQQTSFLESIRGVQTLRLNNQSSAQGSRYTNLVVDSLNAAISTQRLTLIFGSIGSILSGGQRVAVLWIGASLALSQHFSAGMLIAFVAYADQFASRSSALVDYAIQLRLLRIQGERLADIVLTAPESSTVGVYVGPDPAPSIQLDDISFRYSEQSPWIARNFSLQVLPGQSIAITGPSGVGKSTIARILLGLLDPQEGSISIGGIDLKHLGKSRLRDMVGSVMQDDSLFSGSIAENVSFFTEKVSLPDVELACRKAGLHDEIISMPMGYHTHVGDMGSSLSGGQQQRLLLARALYRKPKILVLDEATSHLDLSAEKGIGSRIAELGATRIIIAHRPETIATADRVLVMEGATGFREVTLEKSSSIDSQQSSAQSKDSAWSASQSFRAPSLSQWSNTSLMHE